MRRRNPTPPLFLLAMALAAPVFPQDEPKVHGAAGGAMQVQDADTNGDARVTREEWSRAFDRYDTNRDGVLSAEEIRAGGPVSPYVERFQSLDRDRDGYVSRTEWPLEPASFDRVDRDDDGRLSRSELLTPNRDLTAEERFRELDTNRDGILTPGELQRIGETTDRLDQNRDGAVTRNEYRERASDLEDTWRTRSMPRAQSRFQFLDRNRDNRVSRLEWNGSRADFNRLDRNRDGVLSPNEWPLR